MLNLKKKMIKGIIWNNLIFLIEYGVTFLFTVLLIRILFPKDFGLITLANLIIAFTIMLRLLGVNQTLIQRKKDIAEAANTVFVLQIIMAIILFILLFLTSPLIAHFLGNKMLESIIRVLAIVVVIDSFGVTHASLLEKELDFKKKFLPVSCGSVVYNLVAVFLAFSGFGVWSLVIGQIVKTFTSTVLYWYVSPWRPSFKFNYNLAKDLFCYGKYIFVESSLFFFFRYLDNIFIGKFFGAISLGFYNRANDLSKSILEKFSLSLVFFPAFSKIQDKKTNLKDVFLKSTKYATTILLPLLGIMFAVAPNFVTVLFGQKWVPMIPLLRIFLIRTGLNLFVLLVWDLFKAIGKVRLLLKLQIISLILVLLALFSALDYGIIGIAIAISCGCLIVDGIMIFFLSKTLGLKVITYLKMFYPSFLSCIIMIICVLIMQIMVFPLMGLNVLSNLIFSIIFGLFFYTGVLYLVDKKTFRSIQMVIKIFFS